jgi:hypothetical protein
VKRHRYLEETDTTSLNQILRLSVTFLYQISYVSSEFIAFSLIPFYIAFFSFHIVFVLFVLCFVFLYFYCFLVLYLCAGLLIGTGTVGPERKYIPFELNLIITTARFL